MPLAIWLHSCKVQLSEQQSDTENFTAVSKSSDQGFQLLGANKQSWVAGVANGGSGTEYYFDIKIDTDRSIEFQDLWLKDGSKTDVHVTKKRSTISSTPVTFERGDTITVRASIFNGAPKENEPAPISYDGVALIRYSIDDDQQFLVIKNIIQLQSQNRP